MIGSGDIVSLAPDSNGLYRLPFVPRLGQRFLFRRSGGRSLAGYVHNVVECEGTVVAVAYGADPACPSGAVHGIVCGGGEYDVDIASFLLEVAA